MTTIKDIILLQRDKLTTTLNYYNEIIDNFDRCKDVYNEEILDATEKNDNYIDEINSCLEKIQHNFDLTIINKEEIEKKRISDYKIQQKIFKLFIISLYLLFSSDIIVFCLS